MTREQLAEAAAVSVDTVNNWCVGRSSMRVKHLAACLSLLAASGGSGTELQRVVVELLRREGLTSRGSIKMDPFFGFSSQQAVLFIAPQVSSRSNRLAALGAQDYLSQLGLELIQVSAGESPSELKRCLADLIVGTGIYGIIVSRVSDPEWIETIREAVAIRRTPCVRLFEDYGMGGTPPRFAFVDNVSVGYRAGLYLSKLGHRRIGFFGLHAETTTEVARFQGFAQALKEARLTVPPDHQIWGSMPPSTRSPEVFVADEVGIQPEALIALRYLQQGHISAIFCASELATMAFATSANLQRLGPGEWDDWGLVGVAFSTWPESLVPRKLPYILIPAYEVGKQGARLVAFDVPDNERSQLGCGALVECELRGLTRSTNAYPRTSKVPSTAT